MANRILVTLRPGYFHQIYRRALYYELKQAQVDFDVAKHVPAIYHGRRLDVKEVNFFIAGDMLISAMAIQALTDLLLSRFHYYIRHFHLKRSLILNFNALHLDFKYINFYRDVILQLTVVYSSSMPIACLRASTSTSSRNRTRFQNTR